MTNNKTHPEMTSDGKENETVRIVDSDYIDFLDDGATNHNRNGVLKYGGVSYAVGLIWLSVNEDDDKGSIYKKCRVLKADFYCYRNTVFQCGFGNLANGHRISKPSMAALAADTLIGEWHGVFIADNGWHYVAVHSDNIAPYGDLFFDNEEDAYNHFVTESKKIKWPKTYVPENWNYEGNDGEISYDSILEDSMSTSLKPANMDALFSGKVNKGIAFIGLVVALIILFFSAFSASFLPSFIPAKIEAPFPAVEMANTIAIPPRETEQKINPIVQVVENFSIPKSSTVIDVCIKNFDSIMVSLPGWNLNFMRCRNNIVEAMWRKGVGSLTTLQPYIDQFPFGVNPIFGSRDDFIVSKAINSNAIQPERMRLAKREDVLLTLNSRFSSIGRMQVQDIAPAFANQRNVAGGSRRLASRNNQSADQNNSDRRTMDDLPSFNVELETKTAPVFIKDYFNIPGLKFNFIEWNVNNSTWIFNMRIYLLPANYKYEGPNDA